MKIIDCYFKLLNQVRLMIVLFVPVIASAGAMAVTLNNLYIYNNNEVATKVNIKNLGESGQTYLIPAKSSCGINQPVLFLPFIEEKNNFVIMLSTDGGINPIVIDRDSKLSLASASKIKLPFKGQVKNYNLFGFCGNSLVQDKFIDVQPYANQKNPPNFVLRNCSYTSNYIYLINDNNKVKSQIKVLFDKIKPCQPGN